MPEAFDPDQPFFRADAIRAGVAASALRTKKFRQLLHGIYVAAATADTDRQRIQAALLAAGPLAHASHQTAALLYGAPVPASPMLHLTVPDAGARCDRPEIRCHVNGTAAVCMHNGFPVSSPFQLFVELAEVVDLVDAAILGDWLVAKATRSLPKLLAFVERHGGRRARRAATFIRAGVDSPMETRLRMLLVLAGLPEPAVNHEVRDLEGVVIRRYDLAWPVARLIAEYDGRQHIEREVAWQGDLLRREAIDNAGWRMLVFIAPDIFHTPGRTVDRVHRLLSELKVPGTPVTPSTDWRAHFPGRKTATRAGK